MVERSDTVRNILSEGLLIQIVLIITACSAMPKAVKVCEIMAGKIVILKGSIPCPSPKA